MRTLGCLAKRYECLDETKLFNKGESTILSVGKCLFVCIDFVNMMVCQHKPINFSSRLGMLAQVVGRHGYTLPEWEAMANLLLTIALDELKSQTPTLDFDH